MRPAGSCVLPVLAVEASVMCAAYLNTDSLALRCRLSNELLRGRRFLATHCESIVGELDTHTVL